MDSFLSMGGHSGFIWPAYGIVSTVLVGLLISSRRFAKISAAKLDSLNPGARCEARTAADET